MKRILILAAALLLLAPALAETRLMVVSDIHHLAKPLYEGSALFLRALRAGDGKFSQHGDELLKALEAETAAQRPDALIVTGDLSFNGERASHEALAAAFARIEAGGVPVWVIPGNHDINVAAPVGFNGDSYYRTDSVTPEQFAEIYADFLLPAASGANLSYAVPIDDRLWVAMTDVSFYEGMAQTFGVFTAGHRDWLEAVLKRALDAGAEVVTATHHSLLKHTDFSVESYVMLANDAMAALARKYGLRLNLSGHLHVQHILTEDGLTDAALGAFCAWPHRFALVTLSDDGALSYEARALSEAFLPEAFMDQSRAWYLDVSTEKTRAYIADIPVTDAEREAMAAYAAKFNLAYFSGTYDADDPAWRTDPAYALWQAQADNPFWQYMELVMNEPAQDRLSFAAPPSVMPDS